jgi:hypothetical protein
MQRGTRAAVLRRLRGAVPKRNKAEIGEKIAGWEAEEDCRLRC